MFKNPEYNSIKILLLVVAVAGAGYFAFNYGRTNGGLQSSVVTAGQAPTQQPQQPGISTPPNTFTGCIGVTTCLYVSDLSKRVQEFSLTPAYVTKWGSHGTGDGQFNVWNGLSVAISPITGNVYVVDSGNNRIQEFSPTGSFIMTFGWGVADGQNHFETCASNCQAGIFGGGSGQFSHPGGVAVAPSGNIWVADGFNQRIQEFAPTGAFILTLGFGVSDGQHHFEICTTICQAGTGGMGFGMIGASWTQVASDSFGNAYVTSNAGGSNGGQVVEEFAPSGNFIREFGPNGTGPGQLQQADGIIVAPSGNIYVTDISLNRVEEFTALGVFTGTQWGTTGIGDGQFHTPDTVAVDSLGNVYITDEGNHRVQEFTSSGTFIKTFGWGVLDGQNHFEVCTSNCQVGLSGFGNGEFPVPSGIAILGF